MPDSPDHMDAIRSLILFAQEHVVEFGSWLDSKAGELGIQEEATPVENCAEMLSELHIFIDTLDALSDVAVNIIASELN